MGTYFDITAPVTEIALSDARTGELAFTISNATTAAIRGESVVIPGPGAVAEWFTVDRPVRTYQRSQADQVGLAVAVPADAPPGDYSFVLRTLLGGGVPEEDFDDSPSISFEIPEPPAPPPPPPPKKPFPWWILLVIGAIVVAVIVIAGIVFVATRPGATPSPTPPPQLPDLTFSSFEAQRGGAVIVEIANVGDAAAGPFDVLAVDEDPFGADDQQTTRVTAGLAPGARQQLQFSIGDDIFSEPEVTVTADSSNEVVESDENNNLASNVQ
jgi:hypothetical protein